MRSADARRRSGLARRLGKRVVLLGCSTGGTLSLWLSVQPWAAPHIAQLLLIAPCVSAGRPTKQLYRLLRWPFVVLPRALITPALHRITGPTNRIRYKSVRQAACWTLAYPAEAFLNVIGVFVTVEVVVDPAKILAPGSRRAGTQATGRGHTEGPTGACTNPLLRQLASWLAS